MKTFTSPVHLEWLSQGFGLCVNCSITFQCPYILFLKSIPLRLQIDIQRLQSLLVLFFFFLHFLKWNVVIKNQLCLGIETIMQFTKDRIQRKLCHEYWLLSGLVDLIRLKLIVCFFVVFFFYKKSLTLLWVHLLLSYHNVFSFLI